MILETFLENNGGFWVARLPPPSYSQHLGNFFRFVANKKVDGFVELFRYKHSAFYKEKWKEVHNFDSYSQGGARI